MGKRRCGIFRIIRGHAQTHVVAPLCSTGGGSTCSCSFDVTVDGKMSWISLSCVDRATGGHALGDDVVLYRRSLNIENRLNAVLRLIDSGTCSTPTIAKRLGVSVPTVSRDVSALRERGHNIRSKRNRDSWRYILADRPSDAVRHKSLALTSR